MRLGAYLDQRPPGFTNAVAFVLIVFLGLIDYATGSDVGLSLFYVAPILLVTHRSGRMSGVWMSFFATATWLWADIATGRQYSIAFVPYWNASIRLGFFVIVVFLVVSLKRERASARQDVLTGAGNRQALYEFLGTEIARVRRTQHPLSCALIDVDGFKAINDSLGHHEGDNVLRAIAGMLLQHTRAIDLAVRLGGDEFVMLFPETGAVGAGAVVQRILTAMNGIVASPAGRPLVTLSIGVVTFERAPKHADEVLGRADAVLYRAKRRGGNTVEHEVVA